MLYSNLVMSSLPVDAQLRITSPFGPRSTSIAGASVDHKGIDIGRDFAKAQTGVLAVAPGIVKNSFYNNVRGWVVIVDHGSYKTLYQHLAAKGAAVGSIVRAGTQIGTMGKSSTLNIAVHLHFELIVGGKQIDPEPHIREVGRMTRAQAIQIIKTACKFEDSTMAYLDSYLYRDALLIKIATAIQKGAV